VVEVGLYNVPVFYVRLKNCFIVFTPKLLTCSDSSSDVPVGIALDDNELTALPDMSAFPAEVFAMSIKRNNITTLVGALIIASSLVNDQSDSALILDMSENHISSLPSGVLNARAANSSGAYDGTL
jgi:hypothetical protein